MKENTTPVPFNEQSIGVFDSGVGGLTVLRHIHHQLPHESLIYLADSAHMPYGGKTTREIRERVFDISHSLLKLGCKLLVIACNTATAAAIQELRKAHPDLAVIGMEPGLKPAVSESSVHKIGILATSGTLRSDKFRRLLERYGSSAKVISKACPGLVEQIEKGHIQHRQTEALLRRYIQPMMEADVDTLVLGCTHYPFLLPSIRRLVGEKVTLVDTGKAVARQVERKLDAGKLRNATPLDSKIVFYTTGEVATQQPLFQQLWGEEIELGYLRV